MANEPQPTTPSAEQPTASLAGIVGQWSGGLAQALTGQLSQGLAWALMSPLFLGTVPILAKVAYAAGVDVLTVVAFRTLFAALFLWFAAFIFTRHFIYSSTPAIASSLLAGAVNGIGSIFFYISLTRIDASLGQLINITYLIFVTLFLRLAGQAVSWLTLGRVGLAIFAVCLLTWGGLGPPDALGAGLMLLAAIFYAVQLALSQRILYDIPAPTMTLYAITAMALVVGIPWFFYRPEVVIVTTAGWQALFLMGLVTAISRLTLFLGVKHLGSIQTALLGVLEVVVTIAIAGFFLHERLTLIQWMGAAILVGSVLLVKFERGVPYFIDWWKIFWKR